MLIYPGVAGKFYPDDPKMLQQMLFQLFAQVADKATLPIPKAIIAPHAGYIYSGKVAAAAYAALAKMQHKISRVVLLAPAHRFFVPKIATTKADFYLTPLGRVTIDQDAITPWLSNKLVVIEEAFQDEHAIEVQLPFLQLTLKEFRLLPFLVGNANAAEVEELLERVWGDKESIVVVSSDLSHYHSYQLAQAIDQKGATAILQLKPEELSPDGACGATAIQGLLKVAAKKKLQPFQVDLCNSGDAAGSKDSKDRVVGYGAFHFLDKNL